MNRKSLNKLRIGLVSVGLVGIILFFPFKLPDGYTCLFEHYKGGKHGHNITGPLTTNHAHEMARHYILPFGLIWWFSIAVVSWGILEMRKKRGQKLNENR